MLTIVMTPNAVVINEKIKSIPICIRIKVFTKGERNNPNALDRKAVIKMMIQVNTFFMTGKRTEEKYSKAIVVLSIITNQ